jgi:hypothetical protein
MAGDLPVSLDCSHTQAQSELQRINRAKLKERLAARPSASKDGAVVEYLYAAEWSDRWDHDGSHWGMPREWHVWRFRITKKTKKRIYYMRKGEGIDGAPVPYCSRTDEETIGYIDREAFEMADTTGPEWRHTEAGEIFTRNYYSDDYHLYAAPPPKPPARAAFGAIDADTLKKLKAEMAAAHPDKGGTNEAFREARQRYVDARRRCERAA